MTGADERIADLLNRGAFEAVEMLYDRYGRVAYSLAYRILGDTSLAEDAVQAAFVSVWKNGQSYRPDRGSLSSWLCTIVRNRAIDHLRGRAREYDRELPIDGPLAPVSVVEPWDRVLADLERDAVRAAVASLDPEQRSVIELAYFHGYSQSEISTLTQVPLGTVKGRTRAALCRLRAALAHQPAEVTWREL